ncbi:MAG: class I SAM-dependent methyltransferase [Euryarchaeota archaeon]|nr:class I SAM-dependent methyltransferase [Euryarchaeota archaeon]
MDLPRIHIEELEDQPWVPGFLRHGIVRNVSFIVRLARLYEPLVDVFVEYLRRTRARTVLDLASGYGGPVETMLEALRRRGLEPPGFVLSDFNPHLERFRYLKAQDSHISFVGGRVDALSPPARVRRYPRTMFDAIHHFTPGNARRILGSAARESGGIFVAESTDRALYQLPRTALGAYFGSLLSPLAMRPFSPVEALFTWGVPLIPLMVAHDGVASTFKRYTVEEYRGMVEPLGGRFEWEVGSLRGGVTYVMGWPRGGGSRGR